MLAELARGDLVQPGFAEQLAGFVFVGEEELFEGLFFVDFGEDVGEVGGGEDVVVGSLAEVLEVAFGVSGE